MGNDLICAVIGFGSCMALLMVLSSFGLGILGEYKTGLALCESELPRNQTCEMHFKPKENDNAD